MADQSRAPEEFTFKGNVANNWRLWRQKFDLYLLASGKTNKSEEVKVAILLNLLGDEGIQIYNTFEYDEMEDKNKIDVVLGKFDKYCNPIKNLVYEHFKFFKRDQLPGESVDRFITALRQLASTCEFKEKDVLIRDRIVLGIREARIQEKLLQYPNLELTEAINICRSMENSAATQKEITKDTVNVSAINKQFMKKKYSVKGDVGGCSSGQSKQNAANTSSNTATMKNTGVNENFVIKCFRCGQQHLKGQCPAFNRICSSCKQKGHYRKYCRNKTNVHEIMQDANNSDTGEDKNYSESTDSSDIIVWSITSSEINAIEWFEKIKISGQNISLKIDTGSQVNILNLSDFKKLNIEKDRLNPVSSILSSYSGHKISVLGQIYLNCSYKMVTDKRLLFYVLNSGNPSSILGLNAVQELNILDNRSVNSVNKSDLQEILNLNKSVFSGIGKVNRQYNITLTDNVIPCVSAPRKIPIALKNKVKEKLDLMVSENLIVPVTEPTDWIHPIVIVPKPNGDIRICMDPRNLNKYIKRERFQIPTQDCLFSQLSGAKYFSLLDATSAFLQIPLTYESSLMCTITTSFGRYRYLRLPYGISSAPEIFQRFINDTLEGIQGVIAYFDDILVFGQTIEEHNDNLKVVLEKIKESGLTLNLEKSKLCVDKVNFLGHKVSGEGLSPDERKTQAIREMKYPTNKKELQRFLGMMVYLSKFIPNLSKETSQLRKLLSEKVDWAWTENEEKCFDRLKQLVSTATTLSYFDPNKETTLSVDASPYGLGSAIIQDNRPIEFASVSLTPTQQRYNHIEKELLALVHGCERHHYFLFGQRFRILTDHRPLLGLLKKPLDELSPRIQRLAIRLLRYQFQLEYVPGKHHVIPDTLSRDPISDVINTDYLENNLKVFSILATSKENEARLKQAIDEDETLQTIKFYVLNDWPKHKSAVRSDIKKFWHVKDDIYLHKDILFYKKRIIVPESLKAELLNIIHQSHQGVVSCKKQAQETIYYPGLSTDVENMVLNCPTCQKYSKSNPREPLMPHEIPQFPWQKIGIDFKSLGPMNFLVIVDYYSKFCIVNKLSTKTADSVISTLKNIFAINGIPLEIFSDNGPPFDSNDFHNFAKLYDIQLTTSSPYYPRSNGMVERMIQTVKALLTKAYQNKEDPFLAILNYNTTPKQDLPAPCQLLMGRRLRTKLPVSKEILKPNFPTKGVQTKLEANQSNQKKYYNVSTKQLPELTPNQSVLVQKKIRDWKPGTIINKSGPNDYNVLVDNAEYRRNRQQLRHFRIPSPDETITRQNKLSYLEKPTKQERVDPQQEPSMNSKMFPSDKVPMNLPTTSSDSHNSNLIYKTTSGRIIKPPCRLDL